VVADPASNSRAVAVLDDGGFRGRRFGDPAAALDAAAATECEAVVCDLGTREDASLGFVVAYRRRFPERSTPLVVLSATGDPASVARALEGGADDCLPRAVAPAVLVATLRARLRARRHASLPGALGASPSPPPCAASTLHPAGRLSAIRMGGRVLQVQTEHASVPESRIVTVVMLGGRTVHQRAAAAPPGAGRADLERLVSAQHAEVESALHAKAAARAGRRRAEAPQVRVDRLRAEGLDLFLDGDYAAAVVVWEEALRLAPQDQALTVNLAVARRRRDEPPTVW
jgi:DNA-binding response OmpR family regulator